MLSVAVRSAKLEPSEIPEMVEFASAALATVPAVMAPPSIMPELEIVMASEMYASETVEVAYTVPFTSVARSAETSPVIPKLVVVALVSVVSPVNVLVPLKVLLSLRSVDDAAVMVMFPVPSNDVPFMVRAVWSAVAVEALPVRSPMNEVNHAVVPLRSVVVAFAKVLSAVNVFESERSVEDAAVMVSEPPREMEVPLMVMDEFASSLLLISPAGNETVPPETVRPFEKVFDPEKVLLSLKSVEDANAQVEVE